MDELIQDDSITEKDPSLHSHMCPIFMLDLAYT